MAVNKRGGRGLTWRFVFVFTIIVMIVHLLRGFKEYTIVVLSFNGQIGLVLVDSVDLSPAPGANFTDGTC